MFLSIGRNTGRSIDRNIGGNIDSYSFRDTDRNIPILILDSPASSGASDYEVVNEALQMSAPYPACFWHFWTYFKFKSGW